MSFKDILIALTTYPEPTPASAIDDAISLAIALESRLSAIACEVRIRVPGSFFGSALLDVPAMASTEARKSLINGERLLALFESAAVKRGVFQDRILEHCLTSEIADVFVDHARVRDLTIVPMTDGDFSARFDANWHAESIIFGSGHPTIVLPPAPKRSDVMTMDTVVVAWDSSRPAARAVADSLPILAKAKRTCIVTVANEKPIRGRSGEDLVRHLAHHGIEASFDAVNAAGRTIGEALASHIGACEGDLLVMGAYGHARIREMVLGGATKSMLARSPVPVFFSH